MRTITARVTAWFALSATGTLAILFVFGYVLLERRLISGLDNGLVAHMMEIRAHLGNKAARAHIENSGELDEAVRKTSRETARMFFINIDAPSLQIGFTSPNLLGRSIPAPAGKETTYNPRLGDSDSTEGQNVEGIVYDAYVGGIGPLRVQRFILDPFELTIATPLDPVYDALDSYAEICAALLAIMFLVSIGIGLGASHLVLKPVRLISDTADRIGSDNLSERIPVSDVRDEISDLGRLLNRMFDRLEVAFDQIRHFSDDASHELKTPLSLVRLYSEKILEDPRLPSCHIETISAQLEELARLNHIVDQLLFLSRAKARTVGLDLMPKDPSSFLHAFVQDAAVLSEHYGCRFRLEHKGEGNCRFDEKFIRQVLLNLLNNALNVSPENGLIVIKSELQRDSWRVSVEDEGPGLPSEQRARMFDRFVRFNTPRKGERGSGLGLAICREIVELHDGKICAQERMQGSGLQVTFELPAARLPAKLVHPALA